MERLAKRMNEEIKFIVEEDDGEELVEKKPTLSELEKETEKEIKEERKVVKKKIKKVSKWTFVGIGSVVAIGIIALILYNPVTHRDLPFVAENTDTVQTLGEKDYQDGQFYVEDMAEQGIVNQKTNILQTPSTYGYIVASLEPNDEVSIVGEVFENETNEEVKYFKIKVKDTEGYINKENVDIVWVDDFDLDPIVEVVEKEKVDDSAERQAFNDNKMLENLKKSKSNTKDLEKSMAEMSEQIDELEELVGDTELTLEEQQALKDAENNEEGSKE